jgi:hypothetical protein
VIHKNQLQKLEEVSLDAFAHLQHLKQLSLNNNSLLSISTDKKADVGGRRFAASVSIDLSNNPLDCNCTLKSLVDVVRPEQVCLSLPKLESIAKKAGNDKNGEKLAVLA